MLVVRGVNVFPSAVREVVGAFAPAVSGQVVVRPPGAGGQAGSAAAGPGRARPGHEPDAALADAIRERLREALVVQTQVELVPWRTLERSDYKSKLVEPPTDVGGP